MFRLRLFPRNEKFFDMFIEAARNIHQGARAFQQMLEDFRGTDEQWRAVEEYEHEETRSPIGSCARSTRPSSPR